MVSVQYVDIAICMCLFGCCAVRFGDALVCYKCKYERTLENCLANGVITCQGHDDACFREEAEIIRRNGPRVVSAGCGRSWRNPNSCDDSTGKLRCINWCDHNLCNGRHVKLAKINNSGMRASALHLLLSFISPLLFAYILWLYMWDISWKTSQYD